MQTQAPGKRKRTPDKFLVSFMPYAWVKMLISDWEFLDKNFPWKMVLLSKILGIFNGILISYAVIYSPVLNIQIQL